MRFVEVKIKHKMQGKAEVKVNIKFEVWINIYLKLHSVFCIYAWKEYVR